MKSVFSIEKKSEYQFVLPVSPNEHHMLISNCKPLAQQWQTLSVYNYMPMLEPGDFFNPDNGALIVNSNALEVIGSYFRDVGEVLPLSGEGNDVFYFVNILNCINCLDRQSTLWESGISPPLVARPAFHPSRLPEPGIFKIPETRGTATYLYEDSNYTPSDSFKFQVEEHGLSGINFELVWHSAE